jgi:hypothetical protein
MKKPEAIWGISEITKIMKHKAVTMYCNPCYTCAYSDCDPETCADFHDCYDWEEFYNKDGSLKKKKKMITVFL